MNKKILTAALLGGLAFAQAASAQEFDDRWYLTGSAGFNFQDSDRLTNDAPFVTLGLGKFISPNWSLDGELNYQNPNFDANKDMNWSQYGVSLTCVATSSRKAAAGTRTCWPAWATRSRKKSTTRSAVAWLTARTATLPPRSASVCRPPSRSASLSVPKSPTALISTTRA